MGDIYHTKIDVEEEEEIVDPGLKKSWRSRPYWLYAIILIFIYTAWAVYAKENLREAYVFIISGIGVTIVTAIVSYLIAILIGLLVGLGRISRNVVANNVATFYVEFIRGVPMLVLIFFIALVGVPTVIDWVNTLGIVELDNKSVPKLARAVIALSVTYGAFLAEIFRAGIQSITRGQMEAARSLGMSNGQAMRHVVLPQAVRNVLPALANDFVAMVKDSSLVSLLAVGDITYMTKLYSGTSFRFREGYTILALLYLLMTIILSRIMHQVERRMRNE
jgi:polar amino acid transport system permease protein